MQSYKIWLEDGSERIMDAKDDIDLARKITGDGPWFPEVAAIGKAPSYAKGDVSSESIAWLRELYNRSNYDQTL